MNSYLGLRHRILPGDVIAFCGTGLSSATVKAVTRSPVSHVGIVMRVEIKADGPHPYVMEASPIDGFSGVAVNDLGDRLYQHAGNVWWLPLSKHARLALDTQRLQEFLLLQDQKPYDPLQAVNSALDVVPKIPFVGQLTSNVENYSRFFCSELVVAGLKASGVLPEVNASEITPAELCCLALYEPQYHTLKLVDPKLIIDGYNSINLMDMIDS